MTVDPTLLAVLDTLGEGVVVRDGGGRVTLVNARALELFGVAREALEADLPEGLSLTTHDGTKLDERTVPWVRAAKARETVELAPVHLETPRGTRRVLRLRATPLPGGGVVTAIADVTEPSRVAADLVAAEARLLETSSLARLGTLERDLRTEALLVSPGLCRLLEVPEGTRRLHELWERVVPDDVDGLTTGLNAASGGATVTRTCRVRRAVGGTRHLRAYLSGRRGVSGAVERVVAVFQDDTEQAALANQLKLTERLASLGTLAAGIAHQVNNPLTSVVSNVEAVLASVTRGGLSSEEQAQALTETLASAERIRRVVSDLRAFDFERPNSGQREPVRVESVMQLAADLAANEVKHRAQLKLEFQRTRPVMGLEPRLVELVLHLLVNASRAIEEGRADDNVITLATRQEGDEVIATVQDTGRGISPEVLPHVFDAFFTTDSTGSSTGLGLFVCQGIAQDLGGRLEAQSEPGLGTSFTLRLPTLDQPAPVTPPPLSLPRRSRILVVDDEPFVLRALDRLLGKQHDLVAFDNPNQALKVLSQGEHFDVFLCDIMMPNMSGMDVWDELGRLDPALRERMVFMSGGTFTDRSREFVARVRPLMLEKPFSRAQLNTTIRSLVGGSPRRNDD